MAWQYYQQPPTSYPHQYSYQQTQDYHAWSYGYTYSHPQMRTSITTQPIPTAPSTLTFQPIAPAGPITTTANIPTAIQAPATSTSTFASYTPSFQLARESSSSGITGSSTRGPRRQSQLKGLFAKELPKLMYGFGDDKHVSNDSVAVMEEILIEYIVDVCQTALAPTRKTRLQIEDLRRVLSRPADAKKLTRMEELLFMQEVIKRARMQFQENDTGGPPDGDF